MNQLPVSLTHLFRSLRLCVAGLSALMVSAVSYADEPVTQIDDYDDIPGFLEYHKIPGISIAVIKDFKIDKVLVYGLRDNQSDQPITADTLFQAGSISQSLTAVAALKVFDDADIDIESDINDSLKSWNLDTGTYPSAQRVSLKNLLAHTAGTNITRYEGYPFGSPLPTLLDVLNGTGVSNSPAVIVIDKPNTFQYSAGGYSVVQKALTDIKKASFSQIMNDTLLKPLSMSNSTYSQPPQKPYSERLASGHRANGTRVVGKHLNYPTLAANGLWTTPSDLALFLIELQKSMTGESTIGLNAGLVTRLLTAEINNSALGFDLDVKGDSVYFAKGGLADGFQSLIQAHRRSGDGVVIMTNSDNGFQALTRLLGFIAEQEGWPDY